MERGALRAPIGFGITAGTLMLFVALGAAGVVFWSGIVSLARAWSVPEYSHGPLIPVISGYLFLRQMKQVPASVEPVTDRWPGVALMVFALAIGVLGNLARIPDIVTYAMIIWVYSVILISFGFKRGWVFWPPVLHLVFMLPLPNIVYWKLSLWLQMVSSEIGVAFISLVGIPVYLEGNIIDLGVYRLHVAEACSGLRYLFPVMSFSYIFAVLYGGPTWHKAVILLSAAPITVLMNSVRVGIIGVMVDNVGIEWAEGFMHWFEGWVIFIACILILFGLAALMQRLQAEPKPLSQSIDMDTEGLGHEIGRVRAIAPSFALGTATAMMVLLAGGMTLAPERGQTAPERVPFVLFPKELGAWSGDTELLEPMVEDTLGASDYIAATYTRFDTPPIDFFVAYYKDQTRGEVIHSPEVCLPAGGWEMSTIAPKEVSIPLASGGTQDFRLIRAIILKENERRLVYYWFEQRGKRLTNDYLAKASTIYDSLMMGRSDGALVRFVTPIEPTETVAAAEARLQGFMEHALDKLPEYVPE